LTKQIPRPGLVVESFAWKYWHSLLNLSLGIIFGTNKFPNI
jgi:hypothetical protein